jgi:hypothetical protein
MRKIMSILAVVLFMAMAANADTPQPGDAGYGTIDEDPNTAIPTSALKSPTIEGEGAPAWPRSDVTVGDWFGESLKRAEARARNAEARGRELNARLKTNERAVAEAKSLANGYLDKLLNTEDEVRGLHDKLKGAEEATQVAIGRYGSQLQTANAQEQVIKNLTASLTDRLKFRAELNGQTAIIVVLGFLFVGLWLNQRGKLAKLLARIPDEETREVISRFEQELESAKGWLANADETGNEILRTLEEKQETIERLQASGRGVLRENEALRTANGNLLTEIGLLREALGIANSLIEMLGGEKIAVPPAVNNEPEIVIVHYDPHAPQPSDLPAPTGEESPDPSAPKPAAPEDDATTRYSASDANQPTGAGDEPPIQQPAPDAAPDPFINPDEAATRRLFGSDADSAEKILEGRKTMDGFPVAPPPEHEEAQMGDEGCDDGPGARQRQ